MNNKKTFIKAQATPVSFASDSIVTTSAKEYFDVEDDVILDDDNV